jgi:hypothetical protein
VNVVKNVIRLRRRRRTAAGPELLTLREAILMNIEMFALNPDPASEFSKGWIQALVTTLADAGAPFEEYENELSAEALEGLKALKIDKGNDKDPLMQLEVPSVGDRDVGEIERYKSGLVKAFQLAPTGRIALGSFPNSELAKQAVSEATATL